MTWKNGPMSRKFGIMGLFVCIDGVDVSLSLRISSLQAVVLTRTAIPTIKMDAHICAVYAAHLLSSDL